MKIGFVSVWHSCETHKGVSNDVVFMLNSLFNSAKKYFLNDCDVDYIFISNDNVTIPDVINIPINHYVLGGWHACLMKILSLKYVTGHYDMIFCSDVDQIFINPVTIGDVYGEMVILDHFFKPTVESIHQEVCKTKIPLNFDTQSEYWTMGNFFGGSSVHMKKLLEFSEKWHEEYLKYPYHPDINFYTKYPEELFLIKYIFENNIPHRRLRSISPASSTGGNYFLAPFENSPENYENFTEVRLLHDTKTHFNTLKRVIPRYI